jgi:hypothetical protein
MKRKEKSAKEYTISEIGIVTFSRYRQLTFNYKYINLGARRTRSQTQLDLCPRSKVQTQLVNFISKICSKTTDYNILNKKFPTKLLSTRVCTSTRNKKSSKFMYLQIKIRISGLLAEIDCPQFGNQSVIRWTNCRNCKSRQHVLLVSNKYQIRDQNPISEFKLFDFSKNIPGPILYLFLSDFQG